jgi:hypothetical protein
MELNLENAVEMLERISKISVALDEKLTKLNEKDKARDEEEAKKKAEEKKAEEEKAAAAKKEAEDKAAKAVSVSDEEMKAKMREEVEKAIEARDAMYEKASLAVGEFKKADYKTAQEIAKYACEKLELACDEGFEVSTLNGYLAAYKVPAKKEPVFKAANDEANGETDEEFARYLSGK